MTPEKHVHILLIFTTSKVPKKTFSTSYFITECHDMKTHVGKKTFVYWSLI